MTPLLVGLDVGTTASKAAVFTTDGRQMATGRSETPWVVAPHGVEADPGALVAAAVDAMCDALASSPDGPVLAVGVASMAESGVLLDAHGVPLAPVIAWHDARDAAEVDELASSIGSTNFARRTGLPLRSQWSLTKHRWLLRHYPEAKEAVRWLNVAEWVVLSLGGDEAAEQSLASRTGWLELSPRTWWSDALEWSGASTSLMPELVTAGTPLGTVSGKVGPSRLAGAVLTVAGHDHQVAAVGVGRTRPGDELDSCGTAEALVRTVPIGLAEDVVQRLAESGITTGWHALPASWCLLGATQGGLALQRVLELLGVSQADFAQLDYDAGRADAGRLTVTAVDNEALTISGVTTGVTPAHLWRAAVDAVTAQAWEVHSTMSRLAGTHASLAVTGGWARSAAVIDAKRDLFGPLVTPTVGEAGARGAALFAGMAAGFFSGTEAFPCLN